MTITCRGTGSAMSVFLPFSYKHDSWLWSCLSCDLLFSMHSKPSTNYCLKTLCPHLSVMSLLQLIATRLEQACLCLPISIKSHASHESRTRSIARIFFDKVPRDAKMDTRQAYSQDLPPHDDGR